jgi:hypothetical protein
MEHYFDAFVFLALLYCGGKLSQLSQIVESQRDIVRQLERLESIQIDQTDILRQIETQLRKQNPSFNDFTSAR